jgi:hypothetical protein
MVSQSEHFPSIFYLSSGETRIPNTSLKALFDVERLLKPGQGKAGQTKYVTGFLSEVPFA